MRKRIVKINSQKRTDWLNHFRLLHLPFRTVFCPVVSRTPQILYLKSNADCSPVQVLSRCVTDSDGGGKVWHHIWTCMNESDGINTHSQQATHSDPLASCLSACFPSVSLCCIHQGSITLWEASSFFKQTPFLYILDISSCDIFLVWTRWCHFLPGQACTIEPRDAEGCPKSQNWDCSEPSSQGHASGLPPNPKRRRLILFKNDIPSLLFLDMFFTFI